METAAAVEIEKGGLRRLLFDDFHRCLKKSPHKTLRLFHRYHRLGGDHQQEFYLFFQRQRSTLNRLFLGPKNGERLQEGGIGAHVFNLYKELRKSIDVRVVAADDDWRAVEDKLGDMTMSQMGTAFKFLSARHGAPSPVRISGLGAQLVHAHLPNASATLGCLASDYRGRLVVTYHGDAMRQRFLNSMFEPMLHAVLRKSAAIIVTSEEYLRGSSVLSAYADRCHVIPYGIDLDRYDHYDESAVAKVRALYGDRLVLSVGPLVHYKGFDVLIRAMRNVHGRLLIIGDGPLRDSLSQLCARLNVADKVVFVGDLRNELATPYYNVCDVFALGSVTRNDVFGAVQIRAMSAGKPVVNTRVNSGVPTVSIEGLTGITVPPSDEHAMAGALNELLDKPDLRETYGQAARLRAKQEFSSEVMAARTLSLYQRVMSLPLGSTLPSKDHESETPAELSHCDALNV